MVPEGMPFSRKKAEVKKTHFYEGFCIFYEIGRGPAEAEYTHLRRILMKIVEFGALWGEHVLLNLTQLGERKVCGG